MSVSVADLLQSYFPGFDVCTSRINDKTYLTVEGFVSYVLVEKGRLIIIEEMELLDEYDNVYRDTKMGKHHDSLYAMHAIINIIILIRDIYGVSLITSQSEYLDIYFEHEFNKYVKEDLVIIPELISMESEKFPYLNIDYRFYNTNRRIGYNVPYYPIRDVIEHYNNFSIMGLVIPFDPAIQNVRVLIHGAKKVPTDIYRGVLMEIMVRGNLDDITCMQVIDNYFGTVTREMLINIPLFKNFSPYIVDKYNLVELGYYEEISKMSGISLFFIMNNEEALKPYAINILRDTYCHLDYVARNKRIVRKNNLWGDILMNNRNMTRSFLIKHIKKHPNALIKHMRILENGDEYLFVRYRRRIDWNEFCRVFKGTRLDISCILSIKDRYLDYSKKELIQKIQDEFLKQTI